MFLVALQVTGKLGSSAETPRESEPRNWGQFVGDAAANGAAAASQERISRRVFIAISAPKLF